MAMIRPPQPYPMGLPMQSVPPPIARPPPPMPMPVSKSFLPSSMYTFYTNLSSLIASTLTFHLLCFSFTMSITASCPSVFLTSSFLTLSFHVTPSTPPRHIVSKALKHTASCPSVFLTSSISCSVLLCHPFSPSQTHHLEGL